MSTRRSKRSKRGGNYLNLKVIFALCVFLIGMILFASTISFYIKYHSERFRKSTIVQGIECSGLTVSEAFEKINEKLAEQEITFLFVDDTCRAQGVSFDMKLENEDELEEILSSQNQGDENRIYSVETISVDTEKLKSYLMSLPCLNEENMNAPQDAYLVIGDDNLFYIESEVLGTEIDFNEAYELAVSTLETGGTTIDFKNITDSVPEITSDDLAEEKERLNDILSTTINYVLPDGSTFTLDSSIMRNWISQDQNGKYQINLESNIGSFVETLAEKVSGANSTVAFNATGIGTITLTVPNASRASVNIEAEITQIQNELGTAQEYTRSPIYEDSVFTLDGKTSYVEIDVTRQNVWMYVDGVCIVDTPCVTGNKSNHNTPSGIFTLTYKTTDTYLRGYNDDGSRYSSHVNYWMPFNGGIGMHDALWRSESEFGGTTYIGNGSHGCVNLPLSAAKTIYENIDSSMPIIVYES